MIPTLIRKLMKIKAIYPTNTFKVVGVSGETREKNARIIYQVCGKSAIATEKPEVLMQQLMQIKGFSKEDALLIYNLFLTEKLTSDFRILSIQFEFEPIRFEIEDVHSKYTILLTAEEIIYSNKLLEKFSPGDLTIIYYQLIKEVEEKNKNVKLQLLKKSQLEARECGIYLLRGRGAHE